MPNLKTIIDIGRKLPKSYSYYEWCEYHRLDPDTMERINDE